MQTKVSMCMFSSKKYTYSIFVSIDSFTGMHVHTHVYVHVYVWPIRLRVLLKEMGVLRADPDASLLMLLMSPSGSSSSLGSVSLLGRTAVAALVIASSLS